MNITKLEKLRERLNDTLTDISKVLDDNNLSKGMKVVKVRELKSELNSINATFEDGIKTAKLRALADGVTNLSMLCSKSNIRYQLTGYEDLFLIKESSKPEDGIDKPVFQVFYKVGSDLEPDTLEWPECGSLSKAIEHTMVKLIDAGIVNTDSVYEMMGNNTLSNRILTKAE